MHCGPAGAGQVVKACNQVLVAVTIAGISEALVLGGQHGVDREVILDVLSRGLAANRVMDLRRANFLNHSFPRGSGSTCITRTWTSPWPAPARPTSRCR